MAYAHHTNLRWKSEVNITITDTRMQRSWANICLSLLVQRIRWNMMHALHTYCSITHSTYNRTLPKKHTHKWASDRHRSSRAHAGCRSVPGTNWCVFKYKPNTSTCNKIWTIRLTCFTKRKLNGSFLHISTQWLAFIISLFANHPPLSAHSLTRNFHWNILNFNLMCTITNQLMSPWCKKQKCLW